MKKSTIYGVSTLLFVALVILLIVTFLEMKTEGTKCLTDPLIYGIKEVEKSNRAKFTCTCNLDKINSPTMLLNSDGLSLFESGIPTIFKIKPMTNSSTGQSNNN